MDVRFTNHASEKFDLLITYGFKVSRSQVIEAIESPGKKEARGSQVVSTRALDGEFALRVVHEERKGIILVITFYPVRRERYGV